jgi:hypothetical protein
MVDYDARKVFTYMKIKGFCASRQLLLHCPTSCIHAVVIHPKILWKSPILVCCAEHWRFFRDQPEGARQGSRALPKGQGSAFWQTPTKTLERRKQAALGGFLLDTFLWRIVLLHFPHSPRPCGFPRKEKYLVRGYENPH